MALMVVLVLVLSSSPLLPTPAFAVTGPDVSVSKSHYGGFYVNSPMAAYFFHVPNGASGGPTTGPITLTDTLPTGITFNSIRATSFSDWVCSQAGQVLTCTSPGPIPPGTYIGLTIRVDISAAAVGQRTNIATISTQGDTNPANDTSSPDAVTVTASPGPPDLVILKAHAGEFRVGSANARYRLTVSNLNGGPTTGLISVTDALPTGMTYTSIYSQTGGWSCGATGQNLTCTNPGPLATAGRSELMIGVSIGATAVGQRTNTATVSTAGDVDLTNNTSLVDTVTVTAAASPPDLTVNKNHGGSFMVGSTNAEYVFSVTNLSGGPTTGTITLTDTLPSGIQFGSTSSAPDGWNCAAAGQAVTCATAVVLDPGIQTGVRIRVNILASAVGQRSNTVTVSTPGDSNASNNTSLTDVVTVTPQTFALTVEKVGSGSGTVTSSPAGISCGSDCSETYNAGTLVTLTAVPALGSSFTGWSGACTGVGTCQVTMSAARSITATFLRTNVGVQVGKPTGIPPSSPALQATLTARAGCGPINHITFGAFGHQFDNARVTIIAPSGGPANQLAGFTYTPPAGTTSVTLTIQQVVPSGGATVNPIHFVDGCGDWVTFVGGGPAAFN